ncbi:MAG: NADH-quinone oxidoreductase subunit C [Acidimicrobiales bacterium]
MPSSDAPTEEAAEEEAAGAVDEARDALLEAVTAELGDAVLGHHLIPGRDIWVRVENQAWADTADYLRNRQRFRFFDWLSAVDWLPSPFGRSLDAAVDEVIEHEAGAGADQAVQDGAASFEEAVSGSYAGGEARFQVFARVYSLATGIGINVKTDVDADVSAPTWIEIYPGAAWHEREAFEMFGIGFVGHAGLRKLYLPGDFEGNPLRKDYPLMARLIKPWPGIVDVEPMPEIDQPEASTTPAASTENPEDAS